MMEIVSIINNDKYLDEYIILCSKEWGSSDNTLEFIQDKKKRMKDKVIDVLALLDNKEMIGFISLFKYDGEYRKDLTPWYATMYVKEEYRGRGYSKILNDSLVDRARKVGYDKIYLKSDLVNYYEKYGAKYMEKLGNGEKLYYIDL